MGKKSSANLRRPLLLQVALPLLNGQGPLPAMHASRSTDASTDPALPTGMCELEPAPGFAQKVRPAQKIHKHHMARNTAADTGRAVALAVVMQQILASHSCMCLL